MKRNWDIVREILTRLEALSSTNEFLQLDSFPDERASEISYHIELLLDAGLIDGQMLKALGPGPHDFFAQRLTWGGHEFLDSIRSDTVWEKTKKTFVTGGVEMTLELIKSVAAEVSKTLLKGALGG